jgi:predicted DNA-binding protein (MmcQ/YjbR family)
MDIDGLRDLCLAFPHTTENVQWGHDLCFKVDGKLFAVTALEHGPVRLSFKCTPEGFAELCERDGVIPAPYMARAQWVALEQLNTLPDIELRERITESYRLVWERLTKKRRAELDATRTSVPRATKRAWVSKAKSRSTKTRSANPGKRR